MPALPYCCRWIANLSAHLILIQPFGTNHRQTGAGRAPWLGEFAAVVTELPMILTAAWIICGWLLRDRNASLSEAAGMAAVAFLMLMLAEAALSAVLSGRSVTQHLALYSEPAHLLGLAGQIAFASFPFIRR